MVRVMTNHECLQNYAPIFADHDAAVSWVNLVFGKIDPIEWLNLIMTRSPGAVGAAKEILKACYGYAA